jgi:hypothetical protein
VTITIGEAVLYDRHNDTVRVGIFCGITPDARLYIVPFTGSTLGNQQDIRSSTDVMLASKILREVQPVIADHLFGPTRVFAAGELLAEKLHDSTHRWRLYSVAEDVYLPFGDRLTSISSITVHRWSIERQQEDAETQRQFPSNLERLWVLTRAAEFKYAVPKDEMFPILAEPLFENWDSEDTAATATFSKEQFNGISRVHLHDGKVDVTLTYDLVDRFGPDPYPISDKQVYASNGAIQPVVPARWRAERVNLSPTGHFERLIGKAHRLLVSFSDLPITTTRETYAGGRFEWFPDRVFGPNPDPLELLGGPQAFRVKIYGRDARIYHAPSSSEDSISVVYEKEQLEGEELWALGDVLSVLLGQRVSHRYTETFTSTGRASFEFHDMRPLNEDGEPAILISPYTDTTRLVSTQFGLMLDGMLALRKKDSRKVGAALHHYFEAVNHTYAVSRILMLSVAIDTLVALTIGDQGDKFIIDDIDVARTIFPVVKDAMREALVTAQISGTARDQLLGRMDRLNEMSGRQRQEAFWKHVDLRLTRVERKVLKLRNKVVHEGTAGPELTDGDIWRNRHYSQILANLFNRALLRLLNWNGPYRDATYFRGVEKSLDEGADTLDPPDTLDDED